MEKNLLETLEIQGGVNFKITDIINMGEGVQLFSIKVHFSNKSDRGAYLTITSQHECTTGFDSTFNFHHTISTVVYGVLTYHTFLHTSI